jgi:hypothetical protein
MNYAPAIFAVALACAVVNITTKPAKTQQYVPMFYPPSMRQVPLHLPPVKYDKPYTGKLTIERVTIEQLLARCTNANVRSLGCAFRSAADCLILLVDDASIKAAGWTYELMLRHETAHCNGWPASHPGIRGL